MVGAATSQVYKVVAPTDFLIAKISSRFSCSGLYAGGSWQRSTYSGMVYIPLDRHSLQNIRLAATGAECAGVSHGAWDVGDAMKWLAIQLYSDGGDAIAKTSFQ